MIQLLNSLQSYWKIISRSYNTPQCICLTFCMPTHQILIRVFLLCFTIGIFSPRLSIHLDICSSIDINIYSSINLFIYLFIYLFRSINLSVYICTIYLPIYPSIFLYINLFNNNNIYLFGLAQVYRVPAI